MYNNYIRRFFMEYMQMEPVITRQMVLNELVKAGIKRDIADDLSYRYYKNELTTKDLQYLKENFDIKLKHLEEKIFDTKEELINRMDSKFTELDNKINTVENNLKSEISLVRKDMELNKIELDTKIDKFASEVKGTFKLHAWMFGTIITINVGIFLALISMLYALFIK
ncbi:Bdr family repetitive protein [Borrelia hispanica]|uniref:Bdr family repetitive protein n=1 Tax=Borrelia hispanica TaxID=40835 RepID=UPI000465A10E|nr:Bdr family repetitive protein [Borrelia hispanica]